jgi:4-oxalocrotonate tautomerase
MKRLLNQSNLCQRHAVDQHHVIQFQLRALPTILAKILIAFFNWEFLSLIIFYETGIFKQKSYEHPLTNMYSFMPIVTVSLFGGRTQREKDRLAEAITESVCKILGVDKKEIVVVFQEGPHGNFYSEGIRL